MKRKKTYIFSALISLLFLILISAITFTFVFHIQQSSAAPLGADTVYVYVSAEDETSLESENDDNGWFVQTHNEKIGIFDKNGTLTQIIDVYTKTLPKIDQDELQEGFWVKSEKEMYSIIEAYSD